MGQATISPDPLDESRTTTSIASADDLLAQLAGEEIDRLLAESEAERASAGAERAGGAEAPVVAPGPGRGESADAKVTSIVEPVGTVAPPAAPLAPQVPTPPEPAAPVNATVGVVPARVGKQDLDVVADADAVTERAALIDEPQLPATAVAHDEPV